MHEVYTTAELSNLLRVKGATRIAVDGNDGSGKTTLADKVASDLGIIVIHLDDFIERNLGAYIPNLDTVRLAESIENADGGWVVEGVCVLQALEVLSIKTDTLVYVKKMVCGYWCDEDELDPSEPIEVHLTQLREAILPMAEATGESGELGLSEEIIRYHATYFPHKRAEFVYLRPC